MPTRNDLSNKQVLETRYKSSRANLLLVVLFTAINLILLVTNSDTYFLFSAYIPYALADVGMYLCGKYPAEYYGEEFSSMEFLGSSVFIGLIAIAIVFVALYFISWIFSKNNKSGWMIFALVIFAIDTLGMFLVVGVQLNSLIDIVFHAWVIFSLVTGIIAASKLKNWVEEEIDIPEVQQTEETTENIQNSPILRIADPDVKARILLEAEVLGYAITYRRVKSINELIINGNVYDEYAAVMEYAHSLSAQIGGHLIEAGYDGKMHSYLKLDGEIVQKKVRLF